MKLLINSVDEIARTGNLRRTDNLDGLAMSLSFDIAYNKEDPYWPNRAITTGDKVVFVRDDIVFSGMITDVSQNGKYVKTFTAYDYGWHLNKNEVVVQFRNMTADAAIQKLCDDFRIPIGAICNMPTKISKIYNGEILSDCLKDIIRQVELDTAKNYRMEVRENKFYIEPYSNLILKTSFKPASNVAAFDPLLYPADTSYTESIADLVNAVMVVSDKEKAVQVIGKAEDAASQARYGVLQKVEQLNDRDSAQAGNIAKNVLLENQSAVKSITATFLGDDRVRSGRIISYQGKAHLVSGCTHNYNSAMHTMTLTLEAIE